MPSGAVHCSVTGVSGVSVASSATFHTVSRSGNCAPEPTQPNCANCCAGVPLGEMFGYATELRSMTAGKASYSMEFEKYAPTPPFVQEKVIKERSEKLKEDED